MRWVVLWDTACNFNGFISNQSIFNCLITGASTLSSATRLYILIEKVRCFIRRSACSLILVVPLCQSIILKSRY